MDYSDPIGDYAMEAFGIRYLFPYQRLVVSNILDAVGAEAGSGAEGGGEAPRNQVVILPTGAGKSLCFQLPAALCPGPTVVVYPLLGLMADQARRLSASGVGAAVLKGGMTAGERETVFGSIADGSARIIIVNPESLSAPGVSARLANAKVSHFVIDEAHCVAEWGDTFRPAYLGLGDAIRAIAPGVVTAFTATASPPILERMTRVLFGGLPYKLVSGGPDRPNIRYEVRPSLSMTRSLREAVATAARPAIVFAASRPGVQILAEDLRGAFPGIDARFYHAGLDKPERSALEEWFMASNEGILCSTCAYGMGMDKPNVRTVIHFGQPGSVEAYMQESGRAGRDGAPCDAILIRKATRGDYGLAGLPGTLGLPVPPEAENAPGGLGKKADGSTEPPSSALSASRAARMKEYAEGDYGCRRTFLLKALGADGAEAVACDACDRCEGSDGRRAPGSEEIIGVARRHARRFTAREAAGFLIGAHGSPTAARLGELKQWRLDEAEEAIRGAVELGLLASGRRFPWKGRLTLSREARRPRLSRRRLPGPSPVS
ncbi:MAG: RecQ family ATP-dependent DNA helicase [Spirochaetes bacterium]|nr:RecQ family ATP-dependent DNA helicase [Spirochaetota bacterium]MBU1081527.1 RecQ family ATP-dependent DNA helicase [Spirochaetota bacterium]